MISFSHATKQFSADSFGISDVSFSVQPGEFVFITGPSGSGKTTLMKLLTREYTLSSGEIVVDEQPLSKLKNRHVPKHRRKIGIVYQDYLLVPELNVWENIALPLAIIGKSNSEIESRVTDLLKLVKLTDKATAFPSELSGGEAQQISIARALSTGPEIIFADEPTGNLDADTTRHIAHLLHKINSLGTTILCATHDTSLISIVPNSREIKLKDGRVINSHGTPHLHPSHVITLTHVVEDLDEMEKPEVPERQDVKSEEPQPKPDQHNEKEETKAAEQEENESVQKKSDEEPKTEEKKPSFWQKLFGKKSVTVTEESEVDDETKDEDKEESESAENKKKSTKKSKDTQEKKKKSHKKETKPDSDKKKKDDQKKPDKEKKESKPKKEVNKPDIKSNIEVEVDDLDEETQ